MESNPIVETLELGILRRSMDVGLITIQPN
jgi:hypothetical protein